MTHFPDTPDIPDCFDQQDALRFCVALSRLSEADRQTVYKKVRELARRRSGQGGIHAAMEVAR